jgi:hypothetical protein
MVAELSISVLRYCASYSAVLRYPCVVASYVSKGQNISGCYLPFARILDAQSRDLRLRLAPGQEETAF